MGSASAAFENTAAFSASILVAIITPAGEAAAAATAARGELGDINQVQVWSVTCGGGGGSLMQEGDDGRSTVQGERAAPLQPPLPQSVSQLVCRLYRPPPI